VVEDDPLFRKGIEGVLNRADGMRCQHAFGTAEAALDAIKTGDAPQVILMDIGLPGMTGIAALGEVKRVSPSTSIIILTIYDEDVKVFEAICAGASGYLLKTSSGKDIICGIRQVLDGGASMSPQIARRVLEMFPRTQSPHPAYHITEREQEILRLLVEGLGTKEIADRLTVSYYTIDTHLKNIYAKLYVHSGTGAVSKALREHLV
jgi:DNA-binding NarL/FixJ family response regulator